MNFNETTPNPDRPEPGSDESVEVPAWETNPAAGEDSPPPVHAILQRLDRVEALLSRLVARQTVKDFYTTEEFAQLVGKAEFTVRNWARLGRIKAEKKGSGRGPFQSWVISHAELLRYQRDGLLPVMQRRP